MSTANYNRIRLGDILIERGAISIEDLGAALAFQKENGGKLGRAFIDLEILSEDALLRALSKQFNMNIINFAHYAVDPDVVKKLPEAIARRFRAIAIAYKKEAILVALSDPIDLIAKDEIIPRLGTEVILGLAKESEILLAIDQNYRKRDMITSLAEQLEGQLRGDSQARSVIEDNQESPVIKLLTSVFEDAIQINASDIHIEPDKNFFRIRLRVDGVLQEQIVNEK